MAEAYECGGWLAFDSLDFGSGVDRTFAIGYKFIRGPDEVWSRRFTRFKAGHLASRNAARAVMAVAVPELLRQVGISGESAIFLPALSSAERMASPNGILSVLAKTCAAQCGGAFSRESITKNAHERLHSRYRSAPERAGILDSAQYQAGKIGVPNVFVLDDFVTTGLTLAAIATAVKTANPGAKVYGLALGKNAYPRKDLTNGHIPLRREVVWRKYDKG